MLDTLLLSEAFHIFSEFSFSRTGLPIKIRRRKTKLKIDFFCIWFDAENRKSIENVQRVTRGRSTNLLRIKVAFIDITLVENFGIYVKWDFRQKESLRIFPKNQFWIFLSAECLRWNRKSLRRIFQAWRNRSLTWNNALRLSNF